MSKLVSVGMPLVCVAVTLALGCARVEDAAHSPASAWRPSVPARDVLIRGVAPDPRFGAYGYLVFTRRPTVTDFSRYVAVCEAYGASIVPVEDYFAARYEPSMLMVTFWPLETPVADGDCESLVTQYDYTTAQVIASAVRKLDAAGPLLVAWDRPWNSGQARYRPLVIDLSDFSEEDLVRAFGIWKDRIVRDPAIWNDGFRLVRIREAFRSLIQKYGEIVSLAFTG